MKASEVLDEFGGQLAADLKRPEFRVGLAVCAAGGALCAHARLPFIPSLLLSILAAGAAERLYVVMDDMHAAALANLAAYAALAQPDPQRLFCDDKCPGCEPGAACPEAFDGAPSAN